MQLSLTRMSQESSRSCDRCSLTSKRDTTSSQSQLATTRNSSSLSTHTQNIVWSRWMSASCPLTMLIEKYQKPSSHGLEILSARKSENSAPASRITPSSLLFAITSVLRGRKRTGRRTRMNKLSNLPSKIPKSEWRRTQEPSTGHR